MTACILSERRAVRPFGILGGGSALAGINLLLTSDGRTVNLGGKNNVELAAGERLRILTPGARISILTCREQALPWGPALLDHPQLLWLQNLQLEVSPHHTFAHGRVICATESAVAGKQSSGKIRKWSMIAL